MYGLGNIGTWSILENAPRFPIDEVWDKIQFELRDEERPGLYFWTAFEMADYLHEWLQNTKFPVMYDPQTNSWNTEPNVNIIVDTITGLREIEEQLKLARQNGWKVVSGTRSEEWMDELIEKVESIERISSAMQLAVRNAGKMAVNEARRQAQAAGADFDSGIEQLAHRIKQGAGFMWETAKEEVIDPVTGSIKKGVEEMKKADILKFAVPAAIGAVALLVIAKR